MDTKIIRGRALDALRALRQAAVEKPLLIAAAVAITAIAIFAIAFFWRALLLVLQGLFYTMLALGAILLALFAWAFIHYKKPSLKQLFAEKKTLLAAIKIAEQQYMRRKLSEQDFNKIFKEKQQRLIEVEALIDQQYSEEKKEKIDSQLAAVETKKKHVLRGLLEEKKRLLAELDLAEKSYLKRKIDAKTYQELVQKSQRQLIEMEAQIKEMYNEANIRKVMDGLKKGLNYIEKKQKEKTKQKAAGQKEEQMEIASEIVEQIRKKHRESSE